MALVKDEMKSSQNHRAGSFLLIYLSSATCAAAYSASLNRPRFKPVGCFGQFMPEYRDRNPSPAKRKVIFRRSIPQLR